jgi:hypothetical protein
MTNLWGPTAWFAARGSATRPAVNPLNAGGDADDWFKDCSSPEARDGTEWRAGLLNALIANLRSLVRKSGHPVTNLDDDLLTRSVRRGFWYLSAIGGTATGLTAVLDPAITAYSEITGATFVFVPASDSADGGTTLALNGFAALPITWADGSPIEALNWVAGERVHVVATGTAFVITGISPAKVRSITAGTLRTVALTAASGNWDAPADVSIISRLMVIGGGGSGGNSGTSASRAGGGGGGGASESFAVAVTPGSSNAYTVGQGGLASPSGAGFTGTAGGTSAMFGRTGTGGAAGNGANNGVNAVQVIGGNGTGGNVNYAGQIGCEGIVGTGGGSIWGQPTQRPFTNSGINNPGSSPGGGGPGGADGGGNFQFGGNGGAGIIQIQYFSRFAP